VDREQWKERAEAVRYLLEKSAFGGFYHKRKRP